MKKGKNEYLAIHYDVTLEDLEKMTFLFKDIEEKDLFLSTFAVVKDVTKESRQRIFYLLKVLFAEREETFQDYLIRLRERSGSQGFMVMIFGRYNLSLGYAVMNNLNEIFVLAESLKERE